MPRVPMLLSTHLLHTPDTSGSPRTLKTWTCPRTARRDSASRSCSSRRRRGPRTGSMWVCCLHCMVPYLAAGLKCQKPLLSLPPSNPLTPKPRKRLQTMRSRPKHASPLPLGTPSPPPGGGGEHYHHLGHYHNYSGSPGYSPVSGLTPASTPGGMSTPGSQYGPGSQYSTGQWWGEGSSSSSSSSRAHRLFCETILPLANEDVYDLLPAKTSFIFTEEDILAGVLSR